MVICGGITNIRAFVNTYNGEIVYIVNNEPTEKDLTEFVEVTVDENGHIVWEW